MPNEDENLSIYDLVYVVAKKENEFDVIYIRGMFTIASNVKDAKTALAIKKAYCDGWCDAKHHYCGETNGKD